MGFVDLKKYDFHGGHEDNKKHPVNMRPHPDRWQPIKKWGSNTTEIASNMVGGFHESIGPLGSPNQNSYN